jgi:hypothetical protein
MTIMHHEVMIIMIRRLFKGILPNAEGNESQLHARTITHGKLAEWVEGEEEGQWLEIVL